MTNQIQKLRDEELLKNTANLVREERRVTTLILHHLREIQRRRLFAAQGFASLFDYCTKGLGYSEAAAQRRIASMRLLTEIPEAEEKIQAGALSLSVVAQAQSFFNQEAKAEKPLGIEEKKEVLRSLEGNSSREAERKLVALSTNPLAAVTERVRPISETCFEVRFMADQKLLRDLEKLKGLLAHKNPAMGTGELIQELAEISLHKLDPERTPKKVAKSLPTQKPTETRWISARLRREVWKKAEGRCSYVSPDTGRRCESTHALEIDHRIPWGKGGTSELENLQLLCRSHNQFKNGGDYGFFWEGKKFSNLGDKSAPG